MVGVRVGQTTVLIVDDHTSFAQALGTAIDLQDDLLCVGTADTLANGVLKAQEKQPQVVLMDVNLPDGDGIEGTGLVKERCPTARVVVLTAHADLELMARAAARGASGFLAKESPVADILSAIRTAGDGGLLLEHSTLTAVLARIGVESRKNRPEDPGLTPREQQVLMLMGEGLDPRTISRQMGISVSTARTHVKNVLSKLGVHSQLEAVVTAVRRGLIPSPTP